MSERGAPWPTFKAALKRFLGCPVTVLPPSSNLPSSRFISFNNHAGTGSAGVISHTSYYFNPNVFRSPPAPFCSFHWKQRHGCFTIFKGVLSIMSEHRSQHPPQVRHCGVDASGSRRKQIRFVTANYRVRHLSEHGDDLEKQLGLFFPFRLIYAPKPLDDILNVRSASGVHHALSYCPGSPTAPCQERRYLIVMASCHRCGAETQLYCCGIPTCPACLDAAEAKGEVIPNITQHVTATKLTMETHPGHERVGSNSVARRVFFRAERLPIQFMNT